MQLTELVALLDGKLESRNFKDYAPNGLQVEGKAEVGRILCGVTASQALIDEAIAWQADAILVHHGYFWKNESPVIAGIKRQRIQKLLQHNISLLAYHLPLDAHPELGNNAQLARQLELQDGVASLAEPLLWQGRCTSMSGHDLRAHISQRLGREALLLGNADKQVSRVAWCTGGAQGFFESAIALGVDAYITGEVSEKDFHLANEYGVLFVSAGHHATERYGIAALGDWLQQEAGLQVRFVDLDNPV